MEHRTFLDALDAQKDAQDFLLATVLEGQQQGTALLLCDGQVAWTSAPETLLTQNLSALKKCTTSGVFTLGDTRVFAERFGAGARLVICGGGHVAAAAARLAKLLDLPVTGLEDRPEYADALRETGADQVLCAPFETSLAQIPGSTETYFCVLTRAHAYDITCLKQILQKPAAYVGMMGSRGRSELVRRQLAEAGLDPARVARLHAPIGLAIGAKTAQKIILELKDKLAKGQLAASGETYGGTGVTVIPENKSSEAAAALAVLGYSQNEIAAALKGLDMEQLKLEEIVKHALKKMVK